MVFIARRIPKAWVDVLLEAIIAETEDVAAH
jgi:hypothetical protein